MSSRLQTHIYQGLAGEIQQLSALVSRWGAEAFWSLDEILLSLKIRDTFLVSLRSENEWRGLALGRVMGDGAELFYIFVLSEERGRGAGRQLLAAFIEQAQHVYHVAQVFLEVRPSNLAAIALYRSMGFTAKGKRKRYYRDGEDALIFVKEFGAS